MISRHTCPKPSICSTSKRKVQDTESNALVISSFRRIRACFCWCRADSSLAPIIQTLKWTIRSMWINLEKPLEGETTFVTPYMPPFCLFNAIIRHFSVLLSSIFIITPIFWQFMIINLHLEYFALEVIKLMCNWVSSLRN